MKTDSIFYRLFQTFPGTFFELINRQSSESSAYEFASIELKQTAFRIDGIFLPVPNLQERPIYFLEVQFQKDKEFYARFFSEIFLYLRLYAPTKAWQAVVLFPRRSVEPTEVEPYQVLLESSQVTRLYLNELGDAAEQSIGVGIIQLVVETKKRTPLRVRQLVEQTRSELTNEALQQQVLDLIETIVLYKLPRIGRQELIRMFTRDDLKKTRYYQEVREEVREELQQSVREQVREELQQSVREQVREELQQSVREQVREELQQSVREQVWEELQQSVREEVRQQEAFELIMRLLVRRIGAVNPGLQERVNKLTVAQLENLSEALLDFSNEADLTTWLDENSNQFG